MVSPLGVSLVCFAQNNLCLFWFVFIRRNTDKTNATADTVDSPKAREENTGALTENQTVSQHQNPAKYSYDDNEQFPSDYNYSTHQYNYGYSNYNQYGNPMMNNHFSNFYWLTNFNSLIVCQNEMYEYSVLSCSLFLFPFHFIAVIVYIWKHFCRYSTVFDIF